MATVRADDRCIRFGGEEFVVICDEWPPVRRWRSASASAATSRASTEGACAVTVSIGVATCAEDAADYDGMFAFADRRLYLAKAAGRNCVIGETGTDAGAPKLAWAG